MVAFQEQSIDSAASRIPGWFTTEYASVAIVIDGDVVTKHKVREPIRGGRFLITRYEDNACQVLYSKLTD